MEEDIKEAKLTRYSVTLPDKTVTYGFDPEEAEEKPGAGYYFTCSVCKEGQEMMRGITEPLTGPELLALLDEYIDKKVISSDDLLLLEAQTTRIAIGLPI